MSETSVELIIAATASLLANDAKYKKFAFQVEKALQTFESVNEWADFISFLSRLLKVSRVQTMLIMVDTSNPSSSLCRDSQKVDRG